MRTCRIVRLGVAMGALIVFGMAAGAQAPGNEKEGRPGFEGHRPPMERAFGPGGNHGRWWNNPKVAEKLKLTDEQRKAMDGILLEHREKLIDLRAGLEKAELAMEPLMHDDQPNEARILAQIDKVAQARAELEKANARFLLAIRGKLTPEQRKELEAVRANRGEMRHDWERGGPEGDNQGPDGQRPRGQHHRQAPPPPAAQPGSAPEPPAAPGAGEE